MRNFPQNFLGVYEKALPPGENWAEKFKTAAQLGFDFIEMSIDESDTRLQRLDWSEEQIQEILKLSQKHQVFIRSICFSGQRRYPMGSHDLATRQKSLQLLEKCIQLAFKLNVRIIQLAGYDVYYEAKDAETQAWFLENLQAGLQMANRYAVGLSIEIMDDEFINSLTKYLAVKKACPSPWLSVYPDLGNLAAWHQQTYLSELSSGFHDTVALHIKDTLPVTNSFPGKFKNVEFGAGCVDFLKIFEYLKSAGYQGSFVIEAWYEDFDRPVERLKKAKNYVLNLFEKAGWELC
ncbi:L-xylulose 5-phosphate 3-epimerase [Spiroplasma clarkii]|uniref:L-ribulose-5-phosphate 3-epimerase n=1 Tax=Spiroplasma clarkii TaxID=2139 RepID=A0A1Y0L1J5_9MOLU|nr:L-ribulose-5-phosphate 3-epimerase [Spiroplasma clarkii]ARU91894.1 L-xylulose 5-phosphate 3-epimerase [Spiroplasma clarkii]ATX71241.1 hexulose-6-phosphate isomerase [Spiroplasma clarkii]